MSTSGVHPEAVVQSALILGIGVGPESTDTVEKLCLVKSTAHESALL